jgi:hypothetical protein
MAAKTAFLLAGYQLRVSMDDGDRQSQHQVEYQDDPAGVKT